MCWVVLVACVLFCCCCFYLCCCCCYLLFFFSSERHSIFDRLMFLARFQSRADEYEEDYLLLVISYCQLCVCVRYTISLTIWPFHSIILILKAFSIHCLMISFLFSIPRAPSIPSLYLLFFFVNCFVTL